MYPPFMFEKKWIYWRQGGEFGDDVTITKAIRRVNDKMFSAVVLLCQQVTHKKNNLRRKTCSIIVTGVNITSKRAFLQKVTALLTSTTGKRDFT